MTSDYTRPGAQPWWLGVPRCDHVSAKATFRDGQFYYYQEPCELGTPCPDHEKSDE